MKRLITLSLILIPFVSIISQDIVKLKSALAFAVMLVVGLLSLFNGKIKPFKNKWLLILVGFVWLNIMMSPSSGLKFGNMKLMQFWSWEPFCYILAYLLGIIAIASDEKLDTKLWLNIMVWTGFIMSLFVGIQELSMDQFFIPNGSFHEQWKMGGTLGHPTFVSSFIAMIIPIAFFTKKRAMAYTMIATVLLIQSQVAIGSMILSLCFYFGCKGRKYLIRVIVLLIAISIGVVALSVLKPGYVTSSGRFFEWKRIIKTVNTPIRPNGKGTPVYGKYPITGLGLGSFYYTYHVIQSATGVKCSLYQAHNEYLEWYYNCGLIGLVLLLMAIGHIYKKNFNKNEYRTALLSSFSCIAISAGGLFVFQVGPHMLFTAVIVGLFHNKGEQKWK